MVMLYVGVVALRVAVVIRNENKWKRKRLRGLSHLWHVPFRVKSVQIGLSSVELGQDWSRWPILDFPQYICKKLCNDNKLLEISDMRRFWPSSRFFADPRQTHWDLSPIWELATQIQFVVLALDDYMNVQSHACIGEDIKKLEYVQHGSGTPGRFFFFPIQFKGGSLWTQNIKKLVLDETEELLNKVSKVKSIKSSTNSFLLLLSATLPYKIHKRSHSNPCETWQIDLRKYSPVVFEGPVHTTGKKLQLNRTEPQKNRTISCSLGFSEIKNRLKPHATESVWTGSW